MALPEGYDVEEVNQYVLEDGFIGEASEAHYLGPEDVYRGVESVKEKEDWEILYSVWRDDKSLQELWVEGIRKIGGNLDRLDEGGMIRRKGLPVKVVSTRLSELYLNYVSNMEDM